MDTKKQKYPISIFNIHLIGFIGMCIYLHHYNNDIMQHTNKNILYTNFSLTGLIKGTCHIVYSLSDAI